jgi:hypothetical protein
LILFKGSVERLGFLFCLLTRGGESGILDSIRI